MNARPPRFPNLLPIVRTTPMHQMLRLPRQCRARHQTNAMRHRRARNLPRLALRLRSCQSYGCLPLPIQFQIARRRMNATGRQPWHENLLTGLRRCRNRGQPHRHQHVPQPTDPCSGRRHDKRHLRRRDKLRRHHRGTRLRHRRGIHRLRRHEIRRLHRASRRHRHANRLRHRRAHRPHGRK